MRRITLLLFCLISFSFVVSAVIPSQDYNDALTRSVTDSLYCKVAGDCVFRNLIVYNLSVVGTFFNTSVVNYNITGDVDITGNLYGENASFHNTTSPIIHVDNVYEYTAEHDIQFHNNINVTYGGTQVYMSEGTLFIRG